MRFIDDWGQLVRMSERAFWRFLRDGAAGKNPNASDYGKTIGIVDMHTVDAKPDDFRATLASTPKRKKAR